MDLQIMKNRENLEKENRSKSMRKKGSILGGTFTVWRASGAPPEPTRRSRREPSLADDLQKT